MIFDSIQNVGAYNLPKNIVRMLKAEVEFSESAYDGEARRLNDNDFFMPCIYETQKKKVCRMEAHKKYIDVMYMVEGMERIKLKRTSDFKNVVSPYSEKADCLLAEEEEGVSEIILNAGDFILLYPQDGHCPECTVDSPMVVKKIIGKVKIVK